MSLHVSVHTVAARKLAAVRRQVAIGGVPAAWKPALDKVWAFLRTKPGLRTDGHNVFLYHHPARRDMPMDVDFGVEVVRAFEPEGEVRAVETPAGEAAVAVSGAAVLGADVDGALRARRRPGRVDPAGRDRGVPSGR